MLTRKALLSPRAIPRSHAVKTQKRFPIRTVIFLVVAISVLLAALALKFTPRNNNARDQYEHQLELGRQWTVDPEHAARFWDSARSIAVNNKWSTAEADQLLSGAQPAKASPQNATIKVLSQEFSPAGVAATFTVQDKQGVPVAGLLRKDFRFTTGNRILHHASLAEVTIPSGKQSIAILIDCSGSMKDGGKMEAAKAAIPQLRALAGPGTQFELFSFADTVDQRVPLTSDWRQIEATLPTLNPLGGTALYPAIVDAAKRLATQSGQRRIILIADGENSVGQFSQEQAIADCRSANVSVFCIGISGPSFQPIALEQIAKATGGQFYLAGSANDCAKELRRAVESITTPAYQLMVIDPQPLTAPITIQFCHASDQQAVLEDKQIMTAGLPRIR